MNVLEGIFWWGLTTIPAVGVGIWIYCRAFMKRSIDLDGWRRRAIFAVITSVLWLGNFFIPICYGDGQTYDTKVSCGLLQYEQGEFVTHLGLASIHYYQFADGLEFSTSMALGLAVSPRISPRWLYLIFLIPLFHDDGCSYAWQIPLWPLFALPIACWVVEAFRCRRLIKFNLCPTCQYNLTGSPDRCPECGEDVPARPAVAACSVNSPRFDQ